MKRTIFLVFFSVSLYSSVIAQTIISGVVTDTLNKPVPAASVYLSKTTYGALTDSKGAYSFTVPQEGVYDLIASCVGYKSMSRIIQADGRKQTINITLTESTVQLNEVVVSARDKNRLKNIAMFTRVFLGETPNSKSCRILNTEDIHLYNDEQKKILSGFSVRPVQVINRALGYTLYYDLINFSYNYQTGLLRFSGYPYFQQLKGTIVSTKTWQRNRLSAYYGSKTNFLRTFFTDSLRAANFKIFSYEPDSAERVKTLIKELFINDLRKTENNYYINLYSSDPVMISYTDKHQELSTSILGFQQREYLSSLSFSDTITVFRNGNYYHLYAVTWGGEMSNERIADMLPFDFSPDQAAVGNDTGEEESNMSPVDRYLKVQQNSVCKDQVFVHTDRNMYKPGDTIYFQAYIRDRFTGIFESGSVSLYALLFNEKRTLADSSRFKIESSTASGWMVVPPDAKSGKYHFVAFTGLMQNYDPVNAFQSDLFINAKQETQAKVDISYAKANYHPGDTLEAVVKISDVTGVPSGLERFQCSLTSDNHLIDRYETRTNKEGDSFIRFVLPDTLTMQPELSVILGKDNKAAAIKDFQIPFYNQYLDLRFLPEGGTFIEGIEHRIGFNATNIKGKSIKIVGLLKNREGNVIDTIRSGNYGPGLFVCVPDSGMSVELLNTPGEKKIWPLPAPEKSGVSLSVRPVTEKLFGVEIQSNTYNGDTLLVSGVMNSLSIFSKELPLSGKVQFVVGTEDLPSGVIQVTVFNKSLMPLAERLFYINAWKHIKFEIKPDKVYYTPGGETELSITATDDSGKQLKGIFSISVADSVNGYNASIFTPGIEYTMNYHPYFAVNLPDEVRSKGLENITGAERDLLLMVFGWKKYNWDFNHLQSNIKPETVNYDILNMRVLTALKMRRADRRLDLISLEGPSIMHFITDENGLVSLKLDSLPAITRSVTMMPDPKNKKMITQAMFSIPYNQKFFKSEKLHLPVPVLPGYSYSIQPGNKSYPVPLSEKTIELSEVTVTASRQNKIEFHDQYEERYRYADVRSLEPEMLWTAHSLKDAIYRLVVPYIFTDSYIILEQPHSMFGGAVPALFVLDGMPLYFQGWQQVSTISPEDITSLTILKGKQGFTQYGMQAQGGVIFINTRTTDPKLLKLRVDWKMQHKKDKLLLPIELFRQNVEFYNPKKSEIDTNPAFQHRSTTYWNSEVYLSGDAPAKIRYCNLKRTGPVIITVNGVSFDNLVGSGSGRYIVVDK